MRRKYNPFNSMGGGKTSNCLLAKITRAVLIPLCVFMLFAGLSFTFVPNQPPQAEAASITDEIYNETGDYFEPAVLKKLYAAITGKANATYSTVAQLASTPKGFSEMNQTKIKIGGKIWDVMYLTKAGGNVVLTLCASFSSSENYNPKGGSDSDGNNPGNMYGTSYVRASLLSGDGQTRQYNNGPNALTSLSSPTPLGNTFKPYTTGNFTKYILTPAEAQYQATENNYGRGAAYTYSKGSGYNLVTLNNDAFGTPEGTVKYGTAGSYAGKANYDAWKNDLLWLPSLTELGAGSAGGLWKTTVENLRRGHWWMTRSAAHDQYHRVVTMDGASICIFAADTVNYTNYIYPAFHLNLTLAGAALDVPEQPESSIPVYSGMAQTFDFTSSSVVTGFDSNKMEITGISRNGGVPAGYASPSYTASTVTITEAGTYTVNLKSKTTTENGVTVDWVFSDTGTDTTKISFKVKRRSVAVPSFNVSTGSKIYTGSKLIFAVPDYPNKGIPATATESYPRDALSVAVTRKVNNAAASYTDDFTYNTSDNPKGLEIGAVDVGEYSAVFTISDTTNYEWSDETDGTQTATFTVNPKQLTISYTTTASGNALSWSAEQDTNSATFKISGVVSGDSVGFKLKLTKESDSAFPGAEAVASLATDGSGDYVAVIDKTTFGGNFAAGAYPITPVIEGAQTDNINYSLTTALTGWNKKLVIEASSAGLPSYDNNWRYTKDGGAPTALPTDKKFAYEFNAVTNTGVVYAIELDTTGFADAHINIDTSKYDNGYADASASAAGKYTTKVALITTSPDYLFTLPDGTKSRTMDVELKWDIEKAKIDLSGAVWKYTDANGVTSAYDETKGVPWTGQNYTLTLTGLPAGVTINAANYSGNKEKFIGSYTAKPTTMSYDTTNYETVATPELNWKIVPAEIKIDNTTWITNQHTSGTGVLYLPHIDSPYDGKGILYKYYDLGEEGALHAPVELLNGIADIVSDPSKIHFYYVEAYLSSDVSTDGKTLWNQALVFNDTTNPENGPNTMAFQTGNNLTPVSVTLSGNPAVYDGEAHGVIGKDILVRVGANNFDNTKYEVKYYLYSDSAADNKGTPLDEGEFPVDAGDYLVEVTLTGGADADYFLSTKSLKLTIEPFKFDMSQVRWGYIDGDGKEQIYNPAVPLYYELELDQDGKPVPVDPSDPNGLKKAKAHVMQLVGLPKGDPNGDDAAQLLAKMFEESGLENLISYLQDYTSSSVTPDGAYLKAKYVLNAAGLDSNFEIGEMPDSVLELPEELNWRIEARKIDKPKDNSSQTFDGKAFNLLELAGLDPNGLGVYYTLDSFGYINEDNELVSLDPETAVNIVNAGRYRLTFNLIDNVNVKWNANGVPKITPQSCNIVINQLKLTLTEWEDLTGDNDNPFKPNFAEGEVDSTLYTNVITDSTGKVLTDDEWPVRWNETLTQTIKPSAGNENNIIIEYAEGIPESVTFKLGDDPMGVPATPIKKPVFSDPVNEDGSKECVYTGKAQSFLPDGLQALLDKNRVQLFAVDEEGNETAVEASYFTQTNAGKYKVIVRIKGNYKWEDTDDKADVVFSFEIKKAPLTPVWKTDENGNPVASVPTEFAGLGNIFDYHYYDSDGNEVAEKDLQGGTEYRVGVSVKDEYKDNFDLQNADGTTPQNGVVLADDLYTHTSSGFMGFIGKSFMGLPMWLWLIIILLVLFLLILFIVLIAKKRRKNKEVKEKKQEKKEEKERLEAEKREREEEKRRLQEEREEEKRRREEEREEEKRRREEEREEEKRRREEEREEEKRRREDRLEEERRRMEDERRRREELAAAGTLGMGLGAMNGMNGAPQGMNGMQGGAGMANNMMPPAIPPQMPAMQPPVPPQPIPQGMPPQYMPPMQAPQPPQFAPPAGSLPPSQVVVQQSADSGVYANLRAYEERLRTLEKELQDKRIENIRNAEHARARQEFERMQQQRRREEEERRLRELQREQARREEEDRYRSRYSDAREMYRARRDMEEERLRMLEEQILKKETENRILEARLRDSYDFPPYSDR